MVVERRHGWLPGPHGDALAVKWYAPIASSAATVLVVRSIGHEDDATGHGLHHLGQTLAAVGHPVVLLNLSGSGQSFGALDGDSPERWIDEVEHVAARLAGDERADGEHGILVVGHRIGALAAAHALGRLHPTAVSGAVLWHLPGSGRRVVREWRVMAAAQQTIDAEVPEGELRIGAHRYPGELLHGMERLAGPPALPAHLAVDVIASVRTTVADPLLAALGAGGAVVNTWTETDEWVVSGGSDDVVLPESATSGIGRAAARLTGARPLDLARLGFSATVRPEGTAVREEMHGFDDGQLTGVITRPVGETSSTAVLLLSARGPGNAFVSFARDEAAKGRASLRFDLSGFGMNAPRPGHQPGEIYTATGGHDVARGVAALQRFGYQSVVVVGFCAGGWAALRARPVIPAVAVVAINVELYARSSAWMRRRQAASWTRTQVRRLRAGWRKLTRASDVRPAAARWIRQLVRAGTDVHLVYDENDAGHAHWKSFVVPRLRRQLRTGQVSVTTYPALGHLTEGPDGDAMLAHLSTYIDEVAASTSRSGGR